MKTGMITFIGVMGLTVVYGIADMISFDTGWLIMSLAILFYPIYLYLAKIVEK